MTIRATADDKSTAGEVQEPVRVMTTREPSLIGPLLRLFEGLTSVAVDVSYVTDSNWLERLHAEPTTARTDLFIASELGQIVAAKTAGLTEAITASDLLAQVPALYRDPQGHWIGLTRRMRVIVTTANQVPQSGVTYGQLAGPAWKSHLCMRSGLHPYNVSLTASMLARLGPEKTQTWLRGLKANLARPPKGGDRDQIRAVLDGSCRAALVNTYYVAAMLGGRTGTVNGIERLKVVFPDQGGNGTHVSLSAMSLMKSVSPNRKTRLLMDFMLSRPAQFVYAQDNFEYPVRADVKIDRLVAALGPAVEDNIPIATWTELIGKAAQLVRDVDFDSGPPSQ